MAKVIIVSEGGKLATFRSCTYKMGMALPGSSGWRLDRAMQDASAAIMRRFLEALRG